jgi:hypothetical protein
VTYWDPITLYYYNASETVAEVRLDQVTLLPPAAQLDSAAADIAALLVVLAGDATCATSADTASVTTHRPVVLDIRVVNSDVPDAPVDPDFDK